MATVIFLQGAKIWTDVARERMDADPGTRGGFTEKGAEECSAGNSVLRRGSRDLG